MLNFKTDIPKEISKQDIIHLFQLADSELSNNPKFELNVYFISKEEIALLNNQTRSINEPTDVLSFEDPDNEVHEIYICEDIIKKNSEEFSVEYKEELFRMLLHGYLHILGYDHRDSLNNEEEMFHIQEKVLVKYLGNEN